jgi:D-glycero-D-manno-heptose 1,7-bisphosphate phosphatase
MTASHCVLLAGGLGTRLTEITGGLIPKALVEVGGVPFLHFKLLSLIQMGFTSIDILVGQHGEQIESFVTSGSYPGINIRCFRDGRTLLGTAGAIAAILDVLPNTFWVTYADSYVLADIETANSKFDSEDECVMVVLHNQDRVETSNVSIDLTSTHITQYVKNPPRGTHEWIDYGILRLTRKSFSLIKTDIPADLREVILSQIANGRMRAFETNELFWDIGTPIRHDETSQEFRRRGWI